MAHFAEIRTDNNEVIRVIVVGDNDVANHGGNLSAEAESWVASFHPNDIKLMEDEGWSEYPDTYWKQTSKTNSFRKQYAGKGMTYDSTKDKFIGSQPFSSWVLDENDDWQAPVATPKQFLGSDPTLDNVYIESLWDEDNQRWIGLQQETSTDYIWNPSSSEWEVE